MAGSERQGGAGEAELPQVSISRLPSLGDETEIFGRCEEAAWLDACWSEGANVASVVAFGGVGKSALAWDWLRAMQREGWRGAERVYGWSFYSQGTTDRMTSAAEFISAGLRWFGDADPNVGWDKGERLARLIKERRTLLVLDGVEPLQWGPGAEAGKIKDPALATLVRELGAQNTGLCVITSRLAVRDVGDFAREKCRKLDLAHLTEEAGAALLQARGVTGEEEELRKAVREYGGHSLALALLGSYLSEAGEGDVRRRHEIGPLEEDERLGGHARRVMAAYERMFGSGSAEVGMLRMLGLFDRPADEGEIAALRAEPVVPGLTDAVVGFGRLACNRVVDKLRRVGLLARAEADRDTRLDAHPLVREHFGEQVRRDQPEAWREGNRRLYEHLKGKAKELPETVEEMAPLYSAVVHGCEAGRVLEAREMYLKRVHRGDQFFAREVLGDYGGQLGVLSAFFAAPWERALPEFDNAAQAKLFNAAGIALRGLGRLRDAVRPFELALEKYLSCANWTRAAVVASNLSGLARDRGELATAIDNGLIAKRHADRGNAKKWCAGARRTLADALHQAGRRMDAATLFEEAEAILPSLDKARLDGASPEGFNDMLLELGRLDLVRERAKIVMAAAERNGRTLDVGLSLRVMGRIHLARGELIAAIAPIEQAVNKVRGSGTRNHLVSVLLTRAEVRLGNIDLPACRVDLEEALSLAHRCGFRLHEADAHLGHARLSLAEGNLAPAREHLTKAHRIVDETGYHRRDGELNELKRRCGEVSLVPSRPDNLAFFSPSNPGCATDTASTPGMQREADPAPLPPAHTPPAQRAPTPMATPQRPIDIGIVVALPEEFRELLALAGHPPLHHERDLDCYLFDRGPYRCAATVVGDMGEQQAIRVTERLIALWHPGSIVVVGITGGVHDDLRVGDVHVPSQAVEYIQDAKAVATVSGGFAIVPGAPAYHADFALLGAVRRFEFGHRDAHQRWIHDGRADFAALIPDAPSRARLVAKNLVRSEVRLLADGHVATGPVVGAAAAFCAWIRSHDRNVKSLEMESAAVLLAAQTRHDPKRAIAIRGISDFGDKRKQALDRIGEGSLRQYAMRNAVRLLFALLDADEWPRDGASQNPR